LVNLAEHTAAAALSIERRRAKDPISHKEAYQGYDDTYHPPLGAVLLVVVLLIVVVVLAVVVPVVAPVVVLEPAPTAAPVYEPAASSKSETWTLPPSALVAKLKIAYLNVA
jgi:hypothetical protein